MDDFFFIQKIGCELIQIFQNNFQKNKDNAMIKNNHYKLNIFTLATWVDKALDQSLFKKNIKIVLKGIRIWPFNAKAIDDKIRIWPLNAKAMDDKIKIWPLIAKAIDDKIKPSEVYAPTIINILDENT